MDIDEGCRGDANPDELDDDCFDYDERTYGEADRLA